MGQYIEQAEKFMNDVGATMRVQFQFHGPHFVGETKFRDVYRIEIKRGGESMVVNFGQSLEKSQFRPRPGLPITIRREVPTEYDVLACIQKYEPEADVWDFAREYGYEINDRESYLRVSQIHLSVQQEYDDVRRVFGDVLEQLQEIA